jgi:hypothetical protein
VKELPGARGSYSLTKVKNVHGVRILINVEGVGSNQKDNINPITYAYNLFEPQQAHVLHHFTILDHHPTG